MKTVLLVDDSKLLRDQVAAMLETYGYRVLTAADGDEGLNVLLSGDTVDMVILDIVMPVMDGPAMLSKVRSSEGLEKLPILVLTAADHVEMVAPCLEAGADDYLLKPVDPRLLYQRVQKLLERNPRNYMRTACSSVVEVDTGHDLLTGELLELSEGGAGFLLKAPLDVGDIVKLTFALPRDAEELTVGAKVVHCHKAEGGYHSGVNFVIIEDKVRAKLRGLWERAE